MDVRQRQYEIAIKGTETTTLTTGFLSSCFAVYGWNEAKKVGFLWHLDAHVSGLELIAKDLRGEIGKDLSGFDVYATSGYGLYSRLLATVLICALTLFALGRAAYPCAVVIGGAASMAVAFLYFMWNWILIRHEVRSVFGVKCQFRHASLRARVAYARALGGAVWAGRLDKLGLLQLPRTAVTIDADRGPDLPVLEVGDERPSSEDRFGITSESGVSRLPMRVAEARETGAARVPEGSGWWWASVAIGFPSFATGSASVSFALWSGSNVGWVPVILLSAGTVAVGAGLRGLLRYYTLKRNENHEPSQGRP